MILHRVHRVDVGRRQLPVGQHLDQPALAGAGAGVPFRAEQDAKAGDGPVEGDLAVVGADGAAHFDGFVAAAVAQVPGAVGGVAFADDDAAVGLQLARGFRGAVAFQVGRRGVEAAPVAAQLAGGDAGVGDFAEAHADVVAVFDQVDRPVAQLQLHFDLGVAGDEGGDGRADVLAAEAEAGIDPQQAARFGAAAGHRPFQCVEVGQDAPAFGQIKFAFVGDGHAPGAAVEQPDAEPAFEAGQAPGDGRRGDAQFAGGGDQTALLDQQGEKGEVGNSIHY